MHIVPSQHTTLAISKKKDVKHNHYHLARMSFNLSGLRHTMHCAISLQTLVHLVMVQQYTQSYSISARMNTCSEILHVCQCQLYNQ